MPNFSEISYSLFIQLLIFTIEIGNIPTKRDQPAAEDRVEKKWRSSPVYKKQGDQNFAASRKQYFSLKASWIFPFLPLVFFECTLYKHNDNSNISFWRYNQVIVTRSLNLASDYSTAPNSQNYFSIGQMEYVINWFRYLRSVAPYIVSSRLYRQGRRRATLRVLCSHLEAKRDRFSSCLVIYSLFAAARELVT